MSAEITDVPGACCSGAKGSPCGDHGTISKRGHRTVTFREKSDQMSTLKAVLRLTPTVRALLLELLISFCPAMSQVSSYAKPSEHNAPHLVPQAVPVAEAYFSPQLLRELASIRDAALRDDYTYQQLAHLT